MDGKEKLAFFKAKEAVIKMAALNVYVGFAHLLKFQIGIVCMIVVHKSSRTSYEFRLRRFLIPLRSKPG